MTNNAVSQGTQLYDSTTGPESFTPRALGSPYSSPYNGLAYNPTDNFLYALLIGPLNPATSGNANSYTRGNILVRIDNAGTVTQVGRVTGGTGLPFLVGNTSSTPSSNTSPATTQPTAYAFASGAFNPTTTPPTYWVVSTVGNGGGRTAYQINVASTPPAVTATRSLSAAWSPIDWTYFDGYFWGLTGTTIYRFSPTAPTTSNVSTFSVPSLFTGITMNPSAANRIYGAAWTYTSGTLGFAADASPTATPAETPDIFAISVTNPTSANPTFTRLAHYLSPQRSSNNDGAACEGQPTTFTLNKNAPPVVAPGGQITWTLTATNTGPGASSGFSVSDTVPPSVTNVMTSTPGCTTGTYSSSTGTLVTCSLGALNVGASVTITITGTAPTTVPTCVTNTGTVLGNESPGPVSDSATTCTAHPALSLIKKATCAGHSPGACTSVGAVGDTISYEFTVTNTGPVPISSIAVADVVPTPSGQVAVGHITCPPTPTTLNPGDSTTCTADSPHTVIATDVAAGVLIDTAVATGTVSGTTVTSNRYSVAVDVRPTQPRFTSIVVNSTNTLGLSP